MSFCFTINVTYDKRRLCYIIIFSTTLLTNVKRCKTVSFLSKSSEKKNYFIYLDLNGTLMNQLDLQLREEKLSEKRRAILCFHA